MTEKTPEFDADSEIAFLRETPATDLLANHFFVLAQWAAVHLASSPADLVGAQLVIDVMAALLQAGGERLGANVTLYRNALAEIQQVYVRASQVAPAPEAATGADHGVDHDADQGVDQGASPDADQHPDES